jgi:DNA-directed RNA polymerase subunit F
MQLQLYQLLPLVQTQDEKLIANLLETLHHKFQTGPGDKENLHQVAEKLQSLSNGHPQTLVYILDEKLPADLPQTLELLKNSAKENQLKIDLLNYVLDSYATIPNLSVQAANQLRFAIREIASYNRFDLKLLELALIWAVEPKVCRFFEENLHNAPFFSELIKSMLNTRMIEWETMQRGYVLDSTYRKIILNGLEAEAPEVFRQRHQNAVRHYLTILDSKQGDEETRAMYVCEILYLPRMKRL